MPKAILMVAYKISMAIHMEKIETARRILQRLYWPALYKDVAVDPAVKARRLLQEVCSVYPLCRCQL